MHLIFHKFSIFFSIYLVSSTAYCIIKQAMDWFSKKILVSKLRGFFLIEDERDITIQISPYGKTTVKCENLTLKPQVVNKPETPVHVTKCKVGFFQVVFDSKKMSKEPLSITVDRVKLTVMFNSSSKMQSAQKSEKKKSRPRLDEFYKAVGSEDEYRERSFLQEQIFQIKRMFGEYFMGKLCLKVTNIDVSVQYYVADQPHFLGLELEEIQLKQRLVYKGIGEESTNEEMHCLLKNIGIYLAAKYEENVINRQAQHREVVRMVQKRHKKFILNKKSINMYYNMEEKLINIISEDLSFQIEDILTHELMNFISHVQRVTKEELAFRPGQGELINIGRTKTGKGVYNQNLKISKGTLLWWQHIGDKLIEKFNKRQNPNILKNKRFRKYLFCLLYRYTFGAKAQLEDIIDDHQFFKEDLQIMKYNQYIMEKVHRIQNSKEIDVECKAFVIFLNTVPRNEQKLKKLKIRTIDYNDIKKSNVIVNMENCRKFINIQQTQIQDYLTVRVKISNFSLAVVQPFNYEALKAEMNTYSPLEYAFHKKDILNNYCKEIISQSPQTEQLAPLYTQPDARLGEKKKKFQKFVKSKTYLYLSISDIGCQYNYQGNIYIELPSLQLRDIETDTKITTIKNLSIAKQTMHPEAFNWKITTEQSIRFDAKLFYFNLQCRFAEKLLVIQSYLNKPEPNKPKEKHNYLTELMRQKIPEHWIFNQYSKTSIEIMVHQFSLATPVFEKDRCLLFTLSSLEFSDPVDKKVSFGVENILLERSNFENIHNKLEGGFKKNRQNDQVLLMTSTRPFSGYIEATNQCTLTSILIPFVLMQISCQDLYYFANLMKMWSQILKNPYYFNPKLPEKAATQSQIKETAVQFSKKMSQQVGDKEVIQVKLEGIQFFFISDFINQGTNKICQLLLDTVSFESVSKFTLETVSLSVKDIYIRNCLLGKYVDKEALAQTLRKSCFFEQEPILREIDRQTEFQGQLLMCSDSPIPKTNQEDSQPFLKFTSQKNINLHELRVVNKVNVYIFPLLMFYSPLFAEAARTILSIAFSIAEENITYWKNNIRCKIKTNPFLDRISEIAEPIKNYEFDGEVQVLSVEQFQQLTRLSAKIQRINLLLLNEGEVVYSVSLCNIGVTHTTEPYISRFFFKSTRLSVIDTSNTAGPYPIIFQAKKMDNGVFPLSGSFTTYNSNILQDRQNKSAIFKLEINRPGIHFLKKKVMEFINVLNLALAQFGIVEPASPDQEQKPPSKTNQQSKPAFKYLVSLLSPEIKILRASLSTEGLNALANSIVISNFIPSKPDQTQRVQESDKNILTESNFEDFEGQEHFSLCSVVDDEMDIQFKSFDRENKKEVPLQKILIKLNELHIFGFESWGKDPSEILMKENMDEPQRPMIEIPEIKMQFFMSKLDVNIPSIHGFLEEEDYRVLIRITQENFAESPLMFVPPFQPRNIVKMSFGVYFAIGETFLKVNKKGDNKDIPNRIHELKLVNIIGKNEIWTNNQIEVELGIQDLSLTNFNGVAFIFNKDLEKFQYNINLEQNGKYTNFDGYEVIRKMQSTNRKIQQKLKDNQGDQYLRLLLGNEDDTYNASQRVKEEKNTQKIARWIKGMCKKCVGWCKCWKKTKKNDPNLQKILKMMTHKELEGLESFEEEQFISGVKDPKKTFIYDVQNILGFDYSLDKQKIKTKKKEINMVYMDFFIKSTGEKHMYMQAKKMNILLQKSKSLLDVIGFFSKPYANPEFPQYTRKPQFNNNKPFRMLIQLNDSLMEMKNDEDGRNQRISVLLDAIYDDQTRGDLRVGPGRETMIAEAMVQIMYNNDYLSSPIQLSNPFKTAYHMMKIVPYGQKKSIKTNQRILLTCENDIAINFYIPIFAMKSLNRIIQVTFYETEKLDKSQTSYQKSEDESDFLVMMKKKQSDERMSHNRQSGDKEKEFPQIDQAKEQEKDKIDEGEEKKKKQQPKRETLLSRCMYAPEMQFQIQSKTNTSFLKSSLSEMRYSELTFCKKSNFSFRNMKACFAADYWNLKLEVFEPCLEPWNFKLDQIVSTRDQISSSSIKVSSDINGWEIQDEKYINDLNLNISLALFQTYKELMIKYEQEDFEENQVCYDLTKSDREVYNNLFSQPKRQASLNKGKEKKDFPKELMTYFGRKYIIEGNFASRKKQKIGQKQSFNPTDNRIFVYHSYFDHFRRKKRLTYRTPFRIFNSTGLSLNLWFYEPSTKNQWMIKLNKSQYYAIPGKIYANDFLINVSDGDKNAFDPEGHFISVKYLLQFRAKHKNLQKINPQNRLWKNFFKFSNQISEKWLNFRDIVLSLGNLKFIALSFKSYDKSSQIKNLKGKDLNFYDSYTIITSPIIISNFTYYDYTLIVNRQNKILIPKNSKIEINEHLSKDIENTVIEFEDDQLHQEFKFLGMGYGETKVLLEINKMQSLQLIISRETLSSCFVEIYAEWNITNYTDEDFRILYGYNVFLLDKLSFSCLSHISNKNIDICIIGQEQQTKTINQSNIVDDLVLSKKISPKDQPMLYPSMKKLNKGKCCGCIGNRKSIYEHIEFVFKIGEDPIHSQSKRVEIKYKYRIRNLTNIKLKLFQFTSDFLIVDLCEKKASKYIFYYDFIPKQFFLEMIQPHPEARQKDQEVKLETCMFQLEKFPGASFAFKIKKKGSGIDLLDYHKRFHYLKVEIKKDGEETMIDLMEADKNNFPIYMDNLTDYPIKITEKLGDNQNQEEETFILRPKEKIPFAWSRLIPRSDDGNVLEVQIEDAKKKTYYFNKKSTFEPLKIQGNRQNKRKKKSQNLYIKEVCLVEYQEMDISGMCVLILDLFDNKLRIHNEKDGVNLQLKVDQVLKMDILANKIELQFSDNRNIQIVPSSKTIKTWSDSLHQCMNEDVIDSIFFTIQVYKNSRIFFFRTIKEEDYQSNKQEYTISHLNISIISEKSEEIINIYLYNMSYSQHDKVNRLNYQNYESHQTEKIVTIKKVKVNNQTDSAINPVVVSQIKKSNHPFLELRVCQQKLHLKDAVLENLSSKKKKIVEEAEEQILHFKEIVFFIDEGEMMVEYSLFVDLIQIKNSIMYVNNQYAISEGENAEGLREEDIVVSQKREKLVAIQEQQDSKGKNPWIYINYMEIKPVKMTVSVSLEHNKDERIKLDLIGILRYIPFGIQNAIIEVPSYQYTHIFYDQEELQKIVTKYYSQSIMNNIYSNVGSYELLMPVKLLGGIGTGVKNIFYDPFYELVKKKEIKAVGKKICEGLVSLIVFLLSFIIKFINMIFKIVAFITFDQQFKTKRESFRKQIFKSPAEGAILGGKNWWKVFKSYFLEFTQISENYKKYYCFGYILGFFICLLKIVFWMPKVFVSTYDLLYVIGVGLGNWGYYEENAMKSRSRPPRTFQHDQLTKYNFLYAYGNEIIRKNQLNEIENQEILFVKPVQIGNESNHLILSNYRVLYNNSKVSSCEEIKLYQIAQVRTTITEDKDQYSISLHLSIPNTHKVLIFFSYSKNSLKINFALRQNLIKFLRRLKRITNLQKLEINFVEDQQIKKEVENNNMILGEIVDMIKDGLHEKSDTEEDMIKMI